MNNQTISQAEACTTSKQSVEQLRALAATYTCTTSKHKPKLIRTTNPPKFVCKLIRLLGGFTNKDIESLMLSAYACGYKCSRNAVKDGIRAIIESKHPADWRDEVYKYVTED